MYWDRCHIIKRSLPTDDTAMPNTNKKNNQNKKNKKLRVPFFFVVIFISLAFVLLYSALFECINIERCELYAVEVLGDEPKRRTMKEDTRRVEAFSRKGKSTKNKRRELLR